MQEVENTTKVADIDGNNMLCVSKYKDKLIAYLKTKSVKNINDLWGYSKDYYIKQNLEMGGSYYSDGKIISVILRVNLNDNLLRFIISLDDL